MITGIVHSPARIVSRLLVDLGLGAEPVNSAAAAPVTWPVYTDSEPTTPDNLIVVTDTAGTDDGRAMVTGESMGHDGIQVRVRAVDHATGWTKIDSILNTLAQEVERTAVTIGATVYLVHCLAKFGPILALGKGRPGSALSKFSFNCVVAITPY